MIANVVCGTELELKSAEAFLGVDPVEGAAALLLTPTFPDPESPNDDWLEWCAKVKPLLAYLPRRLKNYVLLARAGTDLTTPLWTEFRRNVGLMYTGFVIEQISRMYFQLRQIDPIAVALWDSGVGRNGVRTRRELFLRLVRLCYSQLFHVTDHSFVRTMLSVFLHHAAERSAQRNFYDE